MSNSAVIILKSNLFAEALAGCLAEPGRLECRVIPFADLLSPRKFDETDYNSQTIILLELNGNSRDNTRVFHRMRNRWPDSRSLLFSQTADADEIAELFNQGAWGIFSPSDSIDILRKAIRTVGQGEIWACRQNSSHIIRHLRRTDRRTRKKDSSILSGRECQVISLVAGGLKNKHIADKLCISEQTVKVHLNNIFKKIGVKDRLQAALFAIDKRLTPGNVPLKD
jgi:two-component system nitrate/nitrite response regulator NarL